MSRKKLERFRNKCDDLGDENNEKPPVKINAITRMFLREEKECEKRFLKKLKSAFTATGSWRTQKNINRIDELRRKAIASKKPFKS